MKSISNYHTHTRLCQHASGLPLDYAIQAQKEGCTELGFSDHCPFPDTFKDFWPDIRMSMDQIPFYLNEIEKARTKVDFPILTGYECEWDKNISEWYLQLRQQYRAQYLVLGQHWLTTNSGRHVYCGDFSSNQTENLKKYVQQTIEAMDSGNFDFLAHPDVFMTNWINWDKNCSTALNDILQAAVQLNMPLEINGYGIAKTPNCTQKGMRYVYPYAEFWEMVTDSKAKIICNSDAHEPEVVIFNAWKARDFALRFNLTPLEKLTLKNL